MNTFFAATQAPCNSPTASGFISGANLPHTCANSTTTSTVFLIAFTIIGGLAFLFLVLAGTRYVLARGNPEAVSKAKNQIQYSLIGLVIAASAALIVNFVLGKL